MTTLATEAATLVSTRAIRTSMTDLSHINSTCLCFHGSCRLCQNSCHCCSRDLTCQRTLHVVLHIALKCPVLPQVLHFALRIDISLSRVQYCHSTHTLTSRHQFPLAWVDCPSPPSFARTDPHLHTTLSRSAEHVDASVVPELVPWPFPRPAIVSVSRAPSPNEVMLTCLINICHLSHLSSRLSGDVHWN